MPLALSGYHEQCRHACWSTSSCEELLPLLLGMDTGMDYVCPLEELLECSPNWLCVFTFPLAVCEGLGAFAPDLFWVCFALILLCNVLFPSLLWVPLPSFALFPGALNATQHHLSLSLPDLEYLGPEMFSI